MYRSPMKLLRSTAVKASWPISRRLVSESSQRASLLRQFESLADGALRLYDSRNQIDQLIAFDSPPVIGEIGIFEGDFAKFLINRYQPAEMHLFDLFRTAESICSGDCDGNNVRVLSGDDVYRNAISAFGSDPRVSLHEGDSKVTVRCMPDDHFDLIYIDGDHNYQGCLADLQNCYEKVKHSGWIAGHDIAINPRKCRSYQKFGVKRAVLDFCEQKNLRVSGLFNDGCVSYAIRVNKQTSTRTGSKS